MTDLGLNKALSVALLWRGIGAFFYIFNFLVDILFQETLTAQCF